MLKVYYNMLNKIEKVLVISGIILICCVIMLSLSSLGYMGGFMSSPGNGFTQSPGNHVENDFSVEDGTSTTTVSIGSSGIGINEGRICLWNGDNYTIINFADNSVTPVYSTSTSCQ